MGSFRTFRTVPNSILLEEEEEEEEALFLPPEGSLGGVFTGRPPFLPLAPPLTPSTKLAKSWAACLYICSAFRMSVSASAKESSCSGPSDPSCGRIICCCVCCCCPVAGGAEFVGSSGEELTPKEEEEEPEGSRLAPVGEAPVLNISTDANTDDADVLFATSGVRGAGPADVDTDPGF
jgi:hypothetical protein